MKRILLIACLAVAPAGANAQYAGHWADVQIGHAQTADPDPYGQQREWDRQQEQVREDRYQRQLLHRHTDCQTTFNGNTAYTSCD